MAQAQITLKMEPTEFTILQEALVAYLISFEGDDSQPAKTRVYFARNILTSIGGGGLPPKTNNGVQQFSFLKRHNGGDEEDE